MLPSKQELFSMYNKVSSRVKQYALNLTPLELKVDEATSNEPWGPHGAVMAEISRAAYDYESYKEIMGVVARRLQSEGENWRHVYKALLLLEYLSKHGPQKVVDELNSNIGAIEKLQRFEYKDKNSKDWGLNVRQRAKELANLVADTERIKRERQKAKQNESKYTGVSADDSRMGFGLGTSSSGFGGGGSSSMGSSGGFGGSALSGIGGGGGPQGFGSSSGYGSAAAPYDDDIVGHTALNTDDHETDDVDVREATRKRIESLRKLQPESPDGQSRTSPPLKGSRMQQAAAEAEGKAPKRLSQVKVDPNIAMSLGVPGKATLATGVPAAPMLDLFGTDEPAPTPAPATAASTDASWNAFAGASDGPTKQEAAKQDEWSDLLEGGSGSGNSFAQQAPSPADPFAALAAPRSAAVAPAASSSSPAAADGFGTDPFGGFSSAQRALGPLPIAPTPKVNKDPFAALTSRDPFTPSSKPQSPLRAGAKQSPKSADPFAIDMFGPVQAAGPPTHTAAAAASSRIGHALPEDMFSGAQQGFEAVHVNVAPNPQISGGSASYAASLGSSPSRFAQQKPGAANVISKPSVASFSAAPQSATPSTEDWFGNMSIASKPSQATAEALGGGVKMAPNAPQPKLPPPVVKQDPFAGLAGF